MLRERGGQHPRGWGLYVFDPTATSAVFIQVTHPSADAGTGRIGAELFDRLRGAGLFVAGAHRDAVPGGAADVAHDQTTPFAVVAEAAAAPGRVAVQPHGHADTTVTEEVVVSSGADPTSLVTAVAARIGDAGFSVCIADRLACAALAGTRNIQGAAWRAADAEFLHLEIARRIRDDRDRTAVLVAAVVEALER